MALFGLFGSKAERTQGTLRKLAKRLTERYGPPENRQKVIAQLGDMGTPEALETLCLRFTIRAEPGIADDEEKETARGLLIAAGEGAIAPIERFIREQEDGIAWGLGALAALAPEGKVLEVVLRELTRLGKVYTRDPEKKLVLLTWLKEHHGSTAGAELETALLPLLEDFSDDVRIGAARALASVSLGEKGREALIQLLLRDRDNARVRGEVLEAMASLGTDVKGHRPTVETLLVEPFFLDREGRVKKRG
jgi:hypothetical protein